MQGQNIKRDRGAFQFGCFSPFTKIKSSSGTLYYMHMILVKAVPSKDFALTPESVLITSGTYILENGFQRQV